MGLINRKFEDRLARFHTLESEIRALEEKRDAVKEKLIEDFEASDVKTVTTPVGTFSLGYRLKWVYSAAVKACEELVKTAKQNEQENGTAKSSTTPYLAFRESKE